MYVSKSTDGPKRPRGTSGTEVLGSEEAQSVLGNEIREQESQCVDGRSNVNCDPEEAVR